jgi:hypothetical protein
MNLDRKRLASWLAVLLLVLTSLATACGDSSSNSPNSPTDGGAADGGSTAAPGGGESAGNEAKGGEPAKGGTNAVGGAEPTAAGSDAGGMEATGSACTAATFSADCPAQECQLVSGCAQGVCQYIPLKVCVSRLAKGTFVPGIADVTVGGLTLHGNLSPFRFQDGPVCQGTTCMTGGIAP